MEKRPVGTFWCIAPECDELQDGTDLQFANYLGVMGRWTCGNFGCDVPVSRVSFKALAEYIASKSVWPQGC